MQISPDILSINGIFLSARATYGDISKIVYKGSSGEQAISYVKKSLLSFLSEKNYIEGDEPKSAFKTYFEELSLLLLVNCEFCHTLKLEEYEHLTYNFPKLSKYLITKVIVEMKLVQYFCKALETIPLLFSCEIFSEFLPSLDKVEFNQLLEDTYCILCSIGNLLVKNKEMKFSDEVDLLQRNVPDFFFYMSRISVEDVSKMKKNTLYKRAGLTLEKLFNLLFFCHKNDLMEGIFIDKLIDSTTMLVRAVSLDMFLYWVEIDLDSGENLQSHIAENAYLINAKYQHHPPASDLVLSLKPFATKPKDIKEQIYSADLDKIVHMVNKADENQKKWFQALIFSSFFSNKKAIKCVNKWGHLCDEEDVSRVLNQAVKIKDEEPKQLALKCASLLNLNQLILVVIRHFYNNGFIILENNQQEVVLWFNKLKDSESTTEKKQHELLLFILQNPNFAVQFILTECIKSEFYISSLYDCFRKLKDILSIHDICLKNLNELMTNTPPSMETSLSYTKLIQTFFEVNLMSFELFSNKILCPSLEEYVNKDSYNEMKHLLIILNNLELRITVRESTTKLFEILFEILLRRSTAVNYNIAVQNVVQEVVHLILTKIIVNQAIDYTYFKEYLGRKDELDFYIHYLNNCNQNKTFAQYTIGNICTENSTKIVCQLMKVLPMCVQDEWNLVCSEIVQNLGVIQLIQILRDMIVLLCDFGRSQENKQPCFLRILEYLKFTIHQFGYILKTKVLPLNNIDNEVIVTKSLVTVMSHFPESLKETEGLNIINSLMTTKSLKHLGSDQQFISNICQIKNSNLCQVIASKILQ